MKISSVEAIYPNYKHVPLSWRTHFWQIVVRIEADNGFVGYGYGGGGQASIQVVNLHFRELLLGKKLETIQDIERLWDNLYFESLPYGRKGIAVMALSGVDLALWDLLAKSENVPVYQLIGQRNKGDVKCYATGSDVNWYSEQGFKAHKFPHRWNSESDYETAVQRASTAREIMGPDSLIMIDTYMSWDYDVTIEMASILGDYNIYWFEDVLTPDKLEDQSKLREFVKPTLISGGEHEFTQYGFEQIASNNALDLWQPDITWCGGVTAGLRILDIASDYKIPVVPHRGGEVWGLHLIVSSQCDPLAEVLPGVKGQEKDILWIGEPEVIDGHISPTEKPGFGVTPNPKLMSV